ncbi:hypothetical protein B9Y78_01440 [Stenotrophomonas maltophilia]|uniref:hypothetical protein n=1 Tax=Stenotrophomonas maltophilia TaxID=40324 RepID=UPI0007F9035D|nr:hypothetical protein [Stenotrophomonas maltophilia]MBN4955334.1 hypothetical protein [Stenotrophomonas maltophilia]MCU1110490.1 hypothetical protein [Stenotrophomonas maltophilia]MDH1686247.1 hypothetical protein [Stenotrophomonas maltophilia]OBU70895.1 hypothetical protein A9K61_19625 [Stenotrophomonas maltophilia]PJL45809.1 hypothetical protein B9Y78_01440 [Stenotrophomonas maltophilia]
MSAILKSVESFPRLSVRSLASFTRLRGVEQQKLLHGQKFPRQAPQVFMQPYYGPPLKGIKSFLETGAAALVDARAEFQRMKQASRRLHCNRVLESFVRSDHAHRGLVPVSIPRYYASMRSLELRLSPDLVAMDGDTRKFIYFNCKEVEADSAAVRLTLEFAHWLLSENGLQIEPEQIEYIDLFTNVLHTGRKVRKGTMRELEEHAKLIELIWPGLEP